jgi:hypothetical protein
MEQLEVTISEKDLEALRWAQECLEYPSFAARLSNMIGTPIETGLKLLPTWWYDKLHTVAELSVRNSLDTALVSLDKARKGRARRGVHKLMALGSGAVSGFLGPPAMLVELPLVTSLMLRSIADIAREQGEDLNSLEARLACVQVFALGSRTHEDDAAETGYYGLRITLGLHFETLSGYPGVAELPATVSLVRAIAARFGVMVTDQTAARMVPVLGAVSASLLNVAFMAHFQRMAKGHFIVRRLERKYGSEKVKEAFKRLRKKEKKSRRAFSPLEGW